MKRWPAAPLFIQTLGLVIATLLAAQVATVLVLLNLPPPNPEFYTVGEVTRALSGAPRTGEQPPRVLIIQRSVRPPVSKFEGPHRASFRMALAKSLGVAPDAVVVAQPGVRVMPFGLMRHGHQDHRPGVREPPPPWIEPILFGPFEVGVRQAGGGWLTVRPRHEFGIDPWQQRLMLVFAVAILVVSPLAWWFSRRLTAPIVRLAAGAQQLGRDPNSPPIVIDGGSAEVAAAVKAYNEMQTRLQSYVEQRTAMVGAIAHDLRTPLTRLRFRAEQTPDAIREKYVADIDEMDAMINAALSFVRDVAPPNRRDLLDLTAVVETVMDEAAEAGGSTSFGVLEPASVLGDPIALKRLIANVVDNALKFGRVAQASVVTDGREAVVTVEDDGPGIPADQFDRVFEPFRRLETSRSRATGGTGLGLAVVRAIATGHGGRVVLSNRRPTGLAVQIRLPLAPPRPRSA